MDTKNLVKDQEFFEASTFRTAVLLLYQMDFTNHRLRQPCSNLLLTSLTQPELSFETPVKPEKPRKEPAWVIRFSNFEMDFY
jgi:hypothetical protein